MNPIENILKAPTKTLPLLTLQEWAAIELTTSLGNDQMLLGAIMDFQEVWKFKEKRNDEEWASVESLAYELFLKAGGCVGLKKTILKLLWPLAYRMMLWKSTYAPSIGYQYVRFHWNRRGIIDNMNTGKKIIQTKDVPMREKFRLACSLCLRGEIFELWSEMSDNDKSFFQKEIPEPMRPLFVFWTCTLTRTSVPKKLMRKALICLIDLGFSEAIKYFFKKISRGDRNDMALYCFDKIDFLAKNNGFINEEDIELGFFAFGHLGYDNKENIFNIKSFSTLCLILHSSNHEVFLKEIKNRLPFLPSNTISDLVYHIFLHYHLELTQDHDYYELFADFWQMIPVSIKNSLTEEFHLREITRSIDSKFSSDWSLNTLRQMVGHVGP